MSELMKRIAAMEAKAEDPAKAVAELKAETGKDAVGCFPIYTPEEIVYAGGFIPVGLWGGKPNIVRADKFVQGFCCSIMRANMEQGMNGVYDGLRAIIIPGFCDTLKCIIENWKVAVPQVPMIGMVYPQMRWGDAGGEYLKAEFKRVRSELEKITGTLITEEKIREAFDLYEEYRETLREFAAIAPKYPQTITPRRRHMLIKAAYFMDKKDYTKEMKHIIEQLKAVPEESADRLRIIATGVIAEPVEILDIFDECGLSIAADDLAQESRQFRTVARRQGSVWEKMAGRVIDQRGCTFLCESKKSRGQMLIDMAKKNNADAVAVIMMKFCDPEEFDYPVYKAQLEKENIPILYLETDQQMDSFEQIRTRVQSFAEMLE